MRCSSVAATLQIPTEVSDVVQRMFTSTMDIERSLNEFESDEGELTPDAACLLAEAARPGLWLRTGAVADEVQIPIGATKIGGRPDMPAGMPWPMRPAYPDAAQRAARHARNAERPDREYSWTTPDNIAVFRRDFREMSEVVAQPFPLQFIAQLNLGDLARAGTLDPDLPSSGLVSIFFDMAEFAESFTPAGQTGMKALFHDIDASRLQRLTPPQELTRLVRYTAIAPMTCAPAPFLAPVPAACAEFDALPISHDVRLAYRDWLDANEEVYGSREGNDWTCHRVGGWPTPVQGDMQMESALVAAGHDLGTSDAYRAALSDPAAKTARDWVFVAQIGSDDTGNLMWGDVGQLYVWIRRSDLKTRDFSGARVVVQSS